MFPFLSEFWLQELWPSGLLVVVGLPVGLVADLLGPVVLLQAEPCHSGGLWGHRHWLQG